MFHPEERTCDRERWKRDLAEVEAEVEAEAKREVRKNCEEVNKDK